MPSRDHAIAVLAGGTSARLGRDKIELRRDGKSLLEHVLGSIPEPWPEQLLVIGPERELPVDLRGRVHFLTEEPAGGGPLAALEAAVLASTAPVIVILTGDSPNAGAAVAPLLAAVTATHSAVLCPTDRRPNPLTAAYRREALESALRQLQPTANGRARDVLDLLPWHEVAAPPAADQDIDTAADAERLGFN